MDKLAYHYNKKKLPAKTEGKYLYYYPCADMEYANIQMGGRGYVVVEVTEPEWEALIELDRIDYNNEHKYVRHTTPMTDGDEDNLAVKQQEQIISKVVPFATTTVEKLDKQALFSSLSSKDQKVLSLLNSGSTQKEAAKELGVTQGYISMANQRAQLNLDYLEYRSAVKTNEGEYIWKCWNMFVKKLQMPLFFDVQLEFVLNYLHPNDIQHFMYWYYSFGEFIRYALTYYIYNEKEIAKEVTEYLSKATDQELAWFKENYSDTVPLIQIVYIRLITEVDRRRKNGLHGNNKAIESIHTAVEKLATQAHITPEQFFAERIYPIIATVRNKRMRQFYRIYSGKNLSE